jgi:putative membrane protein
MMDWNGNGHMTTGGWLWMGIWSVLVIAGIVAFAWYAVRTLDSRRERGGVQSASEILDRRYAAGELDDEEYDRRSKRLSKGS